MKIQQLLATILFVPALLASGSALAAEPVGETVTIRNDGDNTYYEFRINGVHRNPQTVPLPKARGINDNERAEFLIAANRLKAQMTLFSEASTLASSDVF